MPVPNNITDLSTTPAANSPAGSESPQLIDDYLRTQGAFIAQLRDEAKSRSFAVAAAGGTADAITATFSPAVTSLTNGMTLYVRAALANTTSTPTFSPNGLAATTIVRANNQPLVAGDIAGAGHWLELQYDTTLVKWVLQNPVRPNLDLVANPQSSRVALGIAGSPRVMGLVGANNAATPNTKYDVSADVVELRDPVTGAIFTAVNTGTVTSDVTLSGPAANGRDQAGVFSASSWLHKYWIWNGATLATIWSAVAPPTGPTLPSGYTHWAYIGAVYFNASSQIVRCRIRGDSVYYDSPQPVATGAVSTLEVAISLVSAIPQNAQSAFIQSNGICSATAASTQMTFRVRLISGSEFMAADMVNESAGGYAGFAFTCEMPNVSRTIYYVWTGTGALSTRTAVINVLGYKVPNGG